MPSVRDVLHGPWRAVPVLGVTQIVAWGTIFYSPVLTVPLIAAERGWSPSFVMGGFSLCLLVAGLALIALAQEPKRNDRPEATPIPTPTPQRREDNKKPPDATRYSYEFAKAEFLVSHILIEHDALGRGKITFEHRGEGPPIVEPIELSISALGRVLGLWTELRFLDSNENYQASKSFAHLGTYHLKMEDGQRKRTAEFNWSGNKEAWALVTEYRRVSDQAILIFDIKLAREMQPLNAPQLLDEMDTLLTRAGLSDPFQLVPLLNELRTDERIPLIARNHADRILKKIEKVDGFSRRSRR